MYILFLFINCVLHIFKYVKFIINLCMHVRICTYVYTHTHMHIFSSKLCCETFVSTSLPSDCLIDQRIKKKERKIERHEQVRLSIYYTVCFANYIYLSEDRAEILFTLVKQTSCEWDQVSCKQTNKQKSSLSLDYGPALSIFWIATIL